MEFATLEEKAANYFSSISHLASKIMQHNESIREMYRDTWDSLSWEKQEELIDRHIIDPKITVKYSSWKTIDDPPNCFPVWKINSGEKIIVDFEHDDGWTWTDEHSAPFSWKTKSQQDLTLADLDDAGNAKEELNKKSRVGKKPRSPDRAMFESTIATGDRSKNEVEKMFEKFGIKVPGCSDDESDGKVEKSSVDVITKDPDSSLSPSHLYNERSKLLDESTDMLDSKDFVFEPVGAKEANLLKSTSKQNGATVGTKSKEMKSKGKKEKGKGNQVKNKGVKEKMNKKKSLTVTESPGQLTLTGVLASGSGTPNHAVAHSIEAVNLSSGHEAITPIKFVEIGESSTDNYDNEISMMSSVKTNDVFNFEAPDDDGDDYGGSEIVITSQPKKIDMTLDEPLSGLNSEGQFSSGLVIKSGFDFLDNW